MSTPNHIPLSTYRLQLNADFPFSSAIEQLDYLVRLGIGDLYLSPIMRAVAGSAHGYDVTDPTQVNPALGGQSGLRDLSEEARDQGLGILLDIVPNHMAATVENPSWEALLRDGPDAPEAGVFDVFWDPDGKIVLPILGDHYADVLERNELTVEEQDGDAKLGYFDHRFPINDGDASRAALGRYREAGSEEERQAALDSLVAAQHYRLSYWRTGSRAINYRRFFDINDLAAVRPEDDLAFEIVHGDLQSLIADGTISGLRIDHIDGLRRPEAYLERLQRYLSRLEASRCTSSSRRSYPATKSFRRNGRSTARPATTS
ncbi:MAG: alpha-amylase family glycosyl hydrolase [Thermomicrobiales bacterium]